jgi:hypothetical protein
MESKNSNKTGMLTKLTQLEGQVAKLSEQLQSNKKTISLLKKSLAERDVQIHELEAKLAYAQQSLLQKAMHKINQCREQIKNGIDEITPYLLQIQQQIEAIQGIVLESRDLIIRKKMVIQENIHATSDIVQQYPDQAVKFFKKAVDGFVNFLVNEVIWVVGNDLKIIRYSAEQKIKVLFDKIVVAALALLSYGQVIFQVWVVDPVMQKMDTLPVSGKHFNIAVLLNKLISRLRNMVEQGLTNISESVKKSSFWDGKRKIEATQ